MEEFIKLIQDIGFIVDSKSWDMIVYIFGDYKIIINYDLEKWSIRNQDKRFDVLSRNFTLDNIDLLKNIFKSEIRNNKIKELGI